MKAADPELAALVRRFAFLGDAFLLTFVRPASVTFNYWLN
jgi:hypothetical protein